MIQTPGKIPSQIYPWPSAPPRSLLRLKRSRRTVRSIVRWFIALSIRSHGCRTAVGLQIEGDYVGATPCRKSVTMKKQDRPCSASIFHVPPDTNPAQKDLVDKIAGRAPLCLPPASVRKRALDNPLGRALPPPGNQLQRQKNRPTNQIALSASKQMFAPDLPATGSGQKDFVNATKNAFFVLF